VAFTPAQAVVFTLGQVAVYTRDQAVDFMRGLVVVSTLGPQTSRIAVIGQRAKRSLTTWNITTCRRSRMSCARHGEWRDQGLTPEALIRDREAGECKRAEPNKQLVEV
jgi:hypothetical protein